MLSLLLVIILVIMLLGALPTWPYSTNWGPYPANALGIILIIIIVLIFVGKL